MLNKELCRIRTVTAFITLSRDKDSWQDVFADAKRQCDRLVAAITAQGYIVQSLRMVTNPFAEYLQTDSLASAKQDLHDLTQCLASVNAGSDLRLRLAIGEARNAQEIALLPELIQAHEDLCNVCVNVAYDEHGFPAENQLADCAATMQRIAALTPHGQGNFNFTVNVNCPSYIPYFPAGYHRSEQGNAVVLGLETPDVLVTALDGLSPTMPEFFVQAKAAMQDALQEHVNEVMAAVDDCRLDDGWQVLGMDTSAAPSKHCASMVEVYHKLGVPYFGAAGTVAASALLTSVFKDVSGVNQVGFSGLMLAVTEDIGLAQAAQRGDMDIRDLLTYSSVCGIGLDTVPIAGDTPLDKIVAILRDTATMARRLNKPLTVRLFPIPNAKAGEMTQFVGEDLCNTAALAIP